MSDIEPQVVEDLLDAAFGADRFGRTAYRIRKGTDAVPALSFALVDDGVLIGTIQCWPVAHLAPDGTATPLVMVGPVAVRPDVQRGGYGRALMMIGDPEYYGRFFGFDTDATGDWNLPGPFERRRLLARAVNGHGLPTVAGMIGPR